MPNIFIPSVEETSVYTEISIMRTRDYGKGVNIFFILTQLSFWVSLLTRFGPEIMLKHFPGSRGNISQKGTDILFKCLIKGSGSLNNVRAICSLYEIFEK